MDANRETVAIKIGGHATSMYKPTSDQLVGLMMWSDADLPEAVKLSSLTDMFLSLLDDAGKRLFMGQLLAGTYTVVEMAQTLMAAAKAEPEAPAPAPKKRAAKKTAATRK